MLYKSLEVRAQILYLYPIYHWDVYTIDSLECRSSRRVGEWCVEEQVSGVVRRPLVARQRPLVRMFRMFQPPDVPVLGYL